MVSKIIPPQSNKTHHCKNELWVLILFTWKISWRNHAHQTHREKGYSSKRHPCENLKIMRWNFTSISKTL